MADVIQFEKASKAGPKCATCAKRPNEGREYCKHFKSPDVYCSRYVYSNSPVEGEKEAATKVSIEKRDEPVVVVEQEEVPVGKRLNNEGGSPWRRQHRKKTRVLQIDKETGKVIRTFQSTSQAGALCQIPSSTVYDMCVYKRWPTKYDFFFRYEGEYREEDYTRVKKRSGNAVKRSDELSARRAASQAAGKSDDTSRQAALRGARFYIALHDLWDYARVLTPDGKPEKAEKLEAIRLKFLEAGVKL